MTLLGINCCFAPVAMTTRGFVVFLLGVAVIGCGPKESSTTNTTRDEPRQEPFQPVDVGSLESSIANPLIPQPSSPFRFVEITSEAGIIFDQVSGMTEDKHYPTANGSGVAIFDANGDGLMDLYFGTCTRLPLGTVESGPNRLFINEGNDRFRDATAESGLGFQGFCHGIVTGDLDNDGDQDVFLACYGPNRLYRNNGNGTFTEISAEAGIENTDRTVTDPDGTIRRLVNWASGGALLDYDRDGDLDLYVSIQGDWRLPEDDEWCGYADDDIRLYCSPRKIRTAKDVLFRNDGNLKFTDVTDEAGVGRDDGHGFGVIAADFNSDGLIDLYVANDQTPNYLFLNNDDGTFTDAAETTGAAFDVDGRAQSGMGVDAADVDGDGNPEIFVTNFRDEYNTIYRNTSGGFFTDMTPFYGLSQDSRPYVGWGCAVADFDSDGWPDCFVTNGNVDDNHPDYGYEEPPLLLRNESVDPGSSTRRFRISTRGVGSYFNELHVGRGLAKGDLDSDGDIDLVINHKDGPPAILMNQTPLENRHWIRLAFTGTLSNRDAIGTSVVVEGPGTTIHRQVTSGGSLYSSHDRRLVIGLGEISKIDTLTITWPSGIETVLEDVEVDQELEIIEPQE